MKDRILTANDGLSFRFCRQGRSWLDLLSRKVSHIPTKRQKENHRLKKVPNGRGYVRSLEGRYIIFDPDVKLSDGKKYKKLDSIKR